MFTHFDKILAHSFRGAAWLINARRLIFKMSSIIFVVVWYFLRTFAFAWPCSACPIFLKISAENLLYTLENQYNMMIVYEINKLHTRRYPIKNINEKFVVSLLGWLLLPSYTFRSAQKDENALIIRSESSSVQLFINFNGGVEGWNTQMR